MPELEHGMVVETVGDDDVVEVEVKFHPRGHKSIAVQEEEREEEE